MVLFRHCGVFKERACRPFVRIKQPRTGRDICRPGRTVLTLSMGCCLVNSSGQSFTRSCLSGVAFPGNDSRSFRAIPRGPAPWRPRVAAESSGRPWRGAVLVTLTKVPAPLTLPAASTRRTACRASSDLFNSRVVSLTGGLLKTQPLLLWVLSYAQTRPGIPSYMTGCDAHHIRVYMQVRGCFLTPSDHMEVPIFDFLVRWTVRKVAHTK